MSCPSGKLRHETEDSAKRFRGKKSSKGTRMRAYQCPQCRGWHLTKEARPDAAGFAKVDGDRTGSGWRVKGAKTLSGSGAAASVRRFAQLILHGDDAHRAWLLEAAEQYIALGTVPPPAGSGRDRVMYGSEERFEASDDRRYFPEEDVVRLPRPEEP